MCLMAAFVPHRPNKIFPRDSVQRNCFELALIHHSRSWLHLQSHRFGCSKLSAMQMSSRYVRCAPNAVDDRTRDHHADRRFWGHASGPSSSGKKRPSFHPGTDMPLAAAPYRASGLVLWHFSDMTFVPVDVRLWGAGSTGRRNTGFDFLCWVLKLKGLTWSFVELTSHFVLIGLRMHR